MEYELTLDRIIRFFRDNKGINKVNYQYPYDVDKRVYSISAYRVKEIIRIDIKEKGE